MKVKLNITIEIRDPELWVRYCMSENVATPGEIRADVRSYFLNMIQQSSALSDAGGTAEITS